MKSEQQSNNILKAPPSKTGFEQSLEGEQVWPPKSFKSIKSIPCSIKPLTEEEFNSGKVPIRYKLKPDSNFCI